MSRRKAVVVALCLSLCYLCGGAGLNVRRIVHAGSSGAPSPAARTAAPEENPVLGSSIIQVPRLSASALKCPGALRKDPKGKCRSVW